VEAKEATIKEGLIVESTKPKRPWWDIAVDSGALAVGASLVVFVTVFVVAVFSGTIVWLIWPVVGYAFPTAVNQGWLASHLSWWDSVCLTWLFGILIKSTQTNKKD